MVGSKCLCCEAWGAAKSEGECARVEATTIIICAGLLAMQPAMLELHSEV